MPVKQLELDDRTFKDLFEEVRSLIPRHAPDWTDHNVSDPGIMLLELFAWVTEAMLYRINRVPDASRVRLLELLGAAFRLAQPAILSLHVRVEPWPAGFDHYEVKRDGIIWGQTASGMRVPFEVMRTVKFTPQDAMRDVILRQTQLIPSRSEDSTDDVTLCQPQQTPVRKLPRTEVGRPFELVPVGEHFLVLPPEPRSWRPRLTVNGESWTLVGSLRKLQTTNTRCFALKPWLNAVAFGGERRTVDGNIEETGKIPPEGAQIRVTYRWSPTPRAVVTEEFTSTGEAWQIHRLSKPLCQLDLRASCDLEPCLVAQEDDASMTWEYVTRFLDMTVGAAQYSFDPWCNAIRFGGGRYGRPLSPSALLSLRGWFTFGAAVDLPRNPWFCGWPPFDVGDDPQPKLTVDSWECLSPGSNPTTLNEARLQVLAMLRPDWRAVTADDFQSVIQSNLPDIARVICLPGQLPSDDKDQARPGYVGIIVIPGRAAELTALSQQMCGILSSAPDSGRLVAAARDDVISLWNMDTGELTKSLKVAGVKGATFSPNGWRFLTYALDAQPPHKTAELWDARTGTKLKDLDRTTSPVRFSAAGRWLVSMHEDGARLRDASDGAMIKSLLGAPSWDCLAFGPGETSLLAANGDKAHLWILTDDQNLHDAFADMQDKPDEITCAGPFSAAAYSTEGSCAAVAAEDGRLRVWQLRPDPLKMLAVRGKVDLTLGAHGPARSLLLDPAGTRVVTRNAGGITALWSARTGARLADLSVASPVSLLALSGDGRWLVTAHDDQVIRLWNATDGAELRELAHGVPVCTFLFGPNNRCLVALTAAGKYVLREWVLQPELAQLVTTRELDERNTPIVHASGRWLAYGDERLVHIWDVEKAADISALYVDFDDPDVALDGWKLEPVDALPPISCGIQAATGASIPLTRSKHLRIVSADASSKSLKRSVQHWNAEHVSEAGALLATRRLVTTQSEVAGPTYADVIVDVSVVRRLLTIKTERIEDDIHQALSRFFDPLHGGPDKTGWPPGRAIYASEVCQVVEAIEGVDHVERVFLRDGQAENTEQLGIPPHNLVRVKVLAQVR